MSSPLESVRLCPRCGATEAVLLGQMLWPADWACRACGAILERRNGIAQLAPALTESLTSYDPEVFSELFGIEAGNFWFEPRNQLLVGLAHRYFPLAQRYLEVGCGTGFVLSAIASSRSWSRLTGSEVHTTGLEFARQRLGGRAELLQMDACCIPMRSAFDLAGAYDILEHIPQDETAIQQLHAELAPGGGLIVSVPQHPSLWSESDELAHHVRRYRRKELEDKLRANGFEILFSTSYTVALLPLLVLNRLVRRRAARNRTQNRQKWRQEIAPPTSVNKILRRIQDAEVALTLRNVSWPLGGSRVVVARRLG